MATIYENLIDQDMYSSDCSSSRASTPSIAEHPLSTCYQLKKVAQELRKYQDAIDYDKVFLKNMERQLNFENDPLYINRYESIKNMEATLKELQDSVNSIPMTNWSRNISKCMAKVSKFQELFPAVEKMEVT
ncbi:hypothetical protein NPIL_71571 [Nephila pilipes]|uniref:Uncharacterized protein n=1 Tax=Nephila pilipes TaxID=299642 RepID=A0A8X6PAA2_NEPPI|nr:hypothetical protein NPIL_71571 [Nephila pilipes]